MAGKLSSTVHFCSFINTESIGFDFVCYFKKWIPFMKITHLAIIVLVETCTFLIIVTKYTKEGEMRFNFHLHTRCQQKKGANITCFPLFIGDVKVYSIFTMILYSPWFSRQPSQWSVKIGFYMNNFRHNVIHLTPQKNFIKLITTLHLSDVW